jgi:aromatic ring hydroxylase
MPIKNGAEYIKSLRGRNLKVYLFGELVKEPVDHPMIRPSINAVAETYDLAVKDPELAAAQSSISGIPVNRFLHIVESAQDLVNQNSTRCIQQLLKLTRSMIPSTTSALSSSSGWCSAKTWSSAAQ